MSTQIIIYPIAGHIGLAKLIDDFVDLNEFGHLGGPADRQNGPPTLVANLTFQTVLNATTTPQITLVPIVGQTRITGGTVTARAVRSDTHKLIVAVSRSPKAPNSAEAVKIFGGQIITPTGTAAQQSAELAIQQNIIRYELNNRSTVILN